MKIEAIIATGLVTLALLAGCNKEKESTSSTTSVTTPATSKEPTTKTYESTSTTTKPAPAPAEEPTTKTQESTTTTTTDTE